MFYLNSLKNFYSYNIDNKIIIGINPDDKNPKKNIIVSYIGKDDNYNGFIKFINLNLFSVNNFKRIYLEKLLVSSNNKKRIFQSRNSLYKEIDVKINNRKVNYISNLSSLKNFNIFLDYSKQFGLDEKSNNFSSLKKTKYLINNIFNYTNKFESSNQLNFKDEIIVFDNNNVNQEFKDFININNNDITPLGLLYNLIKIDYFKNNELNNNLNKIILIIDYNSNSYFKFNLDNETIMSKKTLILKKIKKCLVDGYNNTNSDEDSLFPVEKSTPYKLIDTEENKKNLEEKITDKVTNNIIQNILNLNINKASDNEIKLINMINNNISNIVKSNKFNSIDTETDNGKIKEIMDIVSNDEETMDLVNKLNDINKTGEEEDIIDPKIQKLKDIQSDVSINLTGTKKTFKDIISEKDKYEITDFNINNPNLVNIEVNNFEINSFDDSYYYKQFENDMIETFKSFNEDPDIKLFVQNIDIEESSDDMTLKKTMKIKFKDDKNTTHNVKIDLPEINNGKFMYINGSKKILFKQLILKPIVKTKSDTVQITTNYNKLFIYRFGQKTSQKLEYLKYLLLDDELKKNIISPNKLSIKKGNCLITNSKYHNTMDYDDISKYLVEISINDLYISFNRINIENLFNENNSKYNNVLSKLEYDKKEFYPIGFIKSTNELILINYKSMEVYKLNKKELSSLEVDIVDLLINNLNEILENSFIEKIDGKKSNVSGNNKFTYNRVKINNKMIPLSIVIASEIGITKMLERYKVKYELSETNRRINIKDNKEKIKFKDKYLIYDISEIQNSLLLSGLNLINTSDFNYDEMDTKVPYLNFYKLSFGSANIYKGIHNTLTLLIDPITKNILSDLKLPTDIFGLLLYANTLLRGLSYTRMNDMSAYRIRSSEQIPALTYKILADNYKIYKDTYMNKNPIKMSLPQDALIKALMELRTVDEYPELNPSLEIEKSAGVNYKGLSGTNLTEAFTKEFRSYDKSMVGILAINTPTSNTCGVMRQLSYNASIQSTRGYINPNKKINGNTDIFSTAELLNPFTMTHADAARIAMMTGQQKHIVSINNMNRDLVGSGVNKNIKNIISDDFAWKAKNSGKIESIDEKNKIATILYDDGKKDIIDLSERLSKNGGGGFYVSNKYELLYNIGEKFKKGDVIADNPKFFKGGKNKSTYTLGTLAKVAMTSGDFGYEDSSIITEKMSKRMSTKFSMKKDIILGVNANVSYLVQENQKINTGDPLIIFEESFEDENINKMLAKLGDELNQEIDKYSRNILKTKYTGRVCKVNIYYNRDIEEFSPSIQKILKKYIKENKTREKLIKENSLNSFNFTHLPSIEKINSNKIKGNDVDGILIEFYLEHDDELGIGDKLVYYTSLKSIVCDVLKEQEAPYSDYNKNENIDCIFTPLSVVTRMTNDIYFSMYSNKALIELKKQVIDIMK